MLFGFKEEGKMIDYIDRKALFEDIYGSVCVTVSKGNMAEIRGINKIMARIKLAPAADVRPAVRGNWETSPRYKGYLLCDSCRRCYIASNWISEENQKWHYCPECGANMREGDNEQKRDT